LRESPHGSAGVTDDFFASLGMNADDAGRAQAAIRRFTKECIDVTLERLRRGERPNVSIVARNAVIRMRGALVELGFSTRQREVFLLFAAADLLKALLRNLEATATKRRVN
jgi:hypothetical protein